MNFWKQLNAVGFFGHFRYPQAQVRRPDTLSQTRHTRSYSEISPAQPSLTHCLHTNFDPSQDGNTSIPARSCHDLMGTRNKPCPVTGLLSDQAVVSQNMAPVWVLPGWGGAGQTLATRHQVRLYLWNQSDFFTPFSEYGFQVGSHFWPSPHCHPTAQHPGMILFRG